MFMNTQSLLAKHIRGIYFGPNWSDNNLKMHLEQVRWQDATVKINGLNSIAALAYHVNYFVAGVSRVLEGGPLDIRDKYSFDLPSINSSEDWNILLDQLWKDGEHFASLIERMPEGQLVEDFTDPKYCSYHGNILGIIEHLHYHLGQIVIIRKMIENEVVNQG